MEDIIAAISALGTCGAALFAWRSARAANQTVQEMRVARERSESPHLSFGAAQMGYGWRWAPFEDESKYQLAKWHGSNFRKSEPPMPNGPLFELANFGGGPALDIRLTFDVPEPQRPEDGQAKYLQNERFAVVWDRDPSIITVAHGKQVGPDPELRLGNGSCSYSSPRTIDLTFPHLGSGEAIKIELPITTLMWAFVSQLSMTRQSDIFISVQGTTYINVEITYLDRRNIRHSARYRVSLRNGWGSTEERYPTDRWQVLDIHGSVEVELAYNKNPSGHP